MVDGRTVEFSPQAIGHMRAGDKIEAITALREASRMGLMAAKQAAEAITASPAMR